MTRTAITVQEPVLDTAATGKKSVAVLADPTATTINSTLVSNGLSISNTFEEKDNTVYLIVYNSADAGKKLTIKAGDSYPNKVLGDYEITVAAGKTVILTIENQSRFENKDGSVNIDFASGFTGTIYAIGKHAGIYLAS